MPTASVLLSEEQQAELQMIVSDGDEGEALRFLKEVVWAQIEAARRKGLRGHMEQGRR